MRTLRTVVVLLGSLLCLATGAACSSQDGASTAQSGGAGTGGGDGGSEANTGGGSGNTGDVEPTCEGTPPVDDCNACWCTDGGWQCTNSSCKCEDPTGTYAPEEEWIDPGGCACSCSTQLETTCDCSCPIGSHTPAQDGTCNSCECGDDGACSTLECGKSCFAPNHVGGPSRDGTVLDGEAYLDEDGCRCECNDGVVSCDEGACTPEASACNLDGLLYHNGESFTDPGSCNGCQCTDGQVICTEIACAVCRWQGHVYPNGSHFWGTCFCTDGVVDCPIPDP